LIRPAHADGLTLDHAAHGGTAIPRCAAGAKTRIGATNGSRRIRRRTAGVRRAACERAARTANAARGRAARTANAARGRAACCGTAVRSSAGIDRATVA
jgi:hypothetical protein